MESATQMKENLGTSNVVTEHENIPKSLDDIVNFEQNQSVDNRFSSNQVPNFQEYSIIDTNSIDNQTIEKDKLKSKPMSPSS